MQSILRFQLSSQSGWGQQDSQQQIVAGRGERALSFTLTGLKTGTAIREIGMENSQKPKSRPII